MKGKLRLSLFILFLILTQTVLAQKNSILFSKVEGLQGKPIGKITGICQDPNGIMWFCGQGQKCLYRYDGTNLTSIKEDDRNPNSLGFSALETVYTDDRGMVWIGGTGLDRYDPSTATFIHFKAPGPSKKGENYIYTILRDRKGNVWIGTANGLYLLDEKTGNTKAFMYDSTNPRSLSNNTVEVIYEDKSGVLWIGTGFPWVATGGGGLNRMNSDGSFTRYLHDPNNPHSLTNDKIRAIFEDNRGVFWVGTSGEGLHNMDRAKGTFERYPYDPAHPSALSAPHINTANVWDGVTFINEDSTGAIWIGWYQQGLSRYDPSAKSISRYRNDNGFPDTSTFKGFVGHDGTLWVATENSEMLYRADPGSKIIRQVVTGKESWGVVLYKNKQFWVPTQGVGLLQYDENNKLIHHFKHDPKDPYSISTDSLYGIFQDPRDDTLWIGTASGIEIMNTATKQFRPANQLINGGDLPHAYVIGFYADKKNNLWIKTADKGLFRWNRTEGRVKQFVPDDKDSNSLGSHSVGSVLEDHNGNIWVGTWNEKGGVYLLDQQTGKCHSYLSGKACPGLFEDSEGDLWVGTFNGLYRYNKAQDLFIPFFDAQSDISTEPVISIVEDQKKNLWLSGLPGMIKINPERNTFFIYGKKFGVQDVRSCIITPEEKIYVSCGTGFYVFSPAELRNDLSPLHLAITDFFFNEGSVAEGDSTLLLSAEKNNRLSLSHNQNSFGFKFSANDYRSPEGVSYFTMMENYDPVWRTSGENKTAFYFNLSPGDYVFRLKAYNSDGTRGEKQVLIHISPPWWKTGWAYALYGLLLILAISVVTRLQKQKIIRVERQRTQARELEQAKEIEKAYTELKSTQAQLIQSEKMASLGELTAGIAHEIQNPLNFVNNFSEVNMELTAELKDELSKMNIDPEYKNQLRDITDNINENQEKILHHGKRADSIVKGMLQHSRTSSAIKEPTDINQLADEYLRLAYHGLRAKDNSFNTTIKTDFDPQIGMINIVAQDVGRLLLNLYNNAFYAVAQRKKREGANYEPMVEVKTKRAAQKVEITIKDNGEGIPKKVMDKIFQPFFTTKPTGQGTGLGLSLSFDIAKAHGGEIKVDSVEGSHTIFIISLPV